MDKQQARARWSDVPERLTVLEEKVSEVKKRLEDTQRVLVFLLSQSLFVSRLGMTKLIQTTGDKEDLLRFLERAIQPEKTLSEIVDLLEPPTREKDGDS